MKILKYIFYSILILIVFTVAGMGAFMYKAKKGFNTYETKPHDLNNEYGENSILLLSKTNAFRHEEAIEASIPIFKEIAERNSWHLYSTEDAGVFNKEQLKLFDLVICNNCTGKVLNPDQRALFRLYIENGGGFMGVHGAGDDSHQWSWYTDTLIGAKFSHHPIKYHIQNGQLNKEKAVDSILNINDSTPNTFRADDEWYVFYNSPRENGANIIYTLDETDLDWDGSLGSFFKDKNFGMGDDHPIVWNKEIGQGRSFYTAMGHHKAAWQGKTHQLIIEEGMRWAGRL